MRRRTTSNQPRRSADSTELDWPGILREQDRWLRTVVFSRLREPEAVDEVMQEVALAALGQKAKPSDPEKAAPWLYRVAVRQVLMYRRKRGRIRKLTDRYVQRRRPTEHDPESPEPLEWLLAQERRKMVRTALSHLDPRDAEMLLLKYTENWSYAQIAKHLGVSHSAVESRLHRARKRMRDQLAFASKGEAPKQ